VLHRITDRKMFLTTDRKMINVRLLYRNPSTGL